MEFLSRLQFFRYDNHIYFARFKRFQICVYGNFFLFDTVKTSQKFSYVFHENSVFIFYKIMML